MIRTLRNISIHLWIVTLITLPFSFYIILVLTRFFPEINPVATGFVILLAVYLSVGFLMDRMAVNIVINLIKEAQAWERSGILNNAQKKYLKVLRVYDTFFFSPFYTKKISRIITGAIAKFELNNAIENQNFKPVTAVYLKMNPENEDIARLWLEQLRRSHIVTSFDQEVLSVLAEKHSHSKQLSDLMIEIFLELGRNDFIAKELYRQALKYPELQKKYLMKIEELSGRFDKPGLQSISFVKPGKVKRKKSRLFKNLWIAVLDYALYLKKIWIFIRSVLSFFIISSGRGIIYIKEHERVQFYLKTGILFAVSTGLLFFMINTVSHMLASKPPEKQPVKIQIKMPKPLTIQVAAYLKRKYAARYIDILKKKAIDARMKKVGGGGKIWFVVRISEFADKKSAAAYGRKLKQQKIIDDFFVSNK